MSVLLDRDIFELLVCCWFWCKLVHLAPMFSVDWLCRSPLFIDRCLHSLPTVTVCLGCPRFRCLAWDFQVHTLTQTATSNYHVHESCCRDGGKRNGLYPFGCEVNNHKNLIAIITKLLQASKSMWRWEKRRWGQVCEEAWRWCCSGSCSAGSAGRSWPKLSHLEWDCATWI